MDSMNESLRHGGFILLAGLTNVSSFYKNATAPFDGIILDNELRTFNIGFYSLFLPLSFLGNMYCIIVVVAIVCHQAIRKSIPDILVGTLSCVELFSMGSFHAISVIATINKAWIFPPSVCAVQSFCVSLYVGLEFLVQAAISLDRYIALTTPFRYQRWGTATIIRLVIGGIIAGSCLLAILLKVTAQTESKLLDTWYICLSIFDLSSPISICVTLATTIIFGVSFIIIIVCNLHLVRTLCQYNSLGVTNVVREITDCVNEMPLPTVPQLDPATARRSICSYMSRKDSSMMLAPRKSKISLGPSPIYFPRRESVCLANNIAPPNPDISSDSDDVTYNVTSHGNEGSDLNLPSLSVEGEGNNKGIDNQSLMVNHVDNLNDYEFQDCSIMITIEEASGDEASIQSRSRESSIPKIELIDEQNNINIGIPEIITQPNCIVPEIVIPEIVTPEIVVPDIVIPDIVIPDICIVPEICIEETTDQDEAIQEDACNYKPEDVYLNPNLNNNRADSNSFLNPQAALLPNRYQQSPMHSPLKSVNSLDPSMAERRTSSRSIGSIYKYPGSHRPSHMSVAPEELQANPILYMSYIQRQVSKVVRVMEKAARKQKREVVLARVVFINAAVFVLTWLPFIATTVMSWFKVPVPPLVQDISLKLVFSHALINPVFHGLCRHNYRKGFLYITRMTLHYVTLGYAKSPGEDLMFYESRRKKMKRHLQAVAQNKTDRADRAERADRADRATIRRQSAICVQALSHHLSTHRLSVQPPTCSAGTPSHSSSRSPSATPLDFSPSPHLQSLFEQYLTESNSDSDLSSIDYNALDVSEQGSLLRNLAEHSFVDFYDQDAYEEDLEMDVDYDPSIGLAPREEK